MWLYRLFMAVHSGLYRLSGGRIGGKIGQSEILLLTTIGRKTGKKRTTPLSFIRESDAYLVTASGGGMPQHPGWYWNAAHGPHPVQIQIGADVMTVDVAEADEPVRQEYYNRFIAVNDDYAAFQAIERTIPILVLTPHD